MNPHSFWKIKRAGPGRYCSRTCGKNHKEVKKEGRREDPGQPAISHLLITAKPISLMPNPEQCRGFVTKKLRSPLAAGGQGKAISSQRNFLFLYQADFSGS